MAILLPTNLIESIILFSVGYFGLGTNLEFSCVQVLISCCGNVQVLARFIILEERLHLTL